LNKKEIILIKKIKKINNEFIIDYIQYLLYIESKEQDEENQYLEHLKGNSKKIPYKKMHQNINNTNKKNYN
jgi:hypothetical protein